MKKGVLKISCLSISLLLCFVSIPIFGAGSGVPEEKITIITYYPAPFGVYNELRSRKMAIGDEYVDNAGDYCWQGEGCSNEIPENIRLQVNTPGSYLSIGEMTIAGGSARGLHIGTTHDLSGKGGGIWYTTNTSGGNLSVASTDYMSIDTSEDPTTGRQYPIRMQTWSDSGSWKLGNVGIGTVTPRAVLDVASTTSGFVPPRMSAFQRDVISSPVEGSMVYVNDPTVKEYNYYDGVSWQALGGGGGCYVDYSRPGGQPVGASCSVSGFTIRASLGSWGFCSSYISGESAAAYFLPPGGSCYSGTTSKPYSYAYLCCE